MIVWAAVAPMPAVACGDPGLDRERQVVAGGLHVRVEAQSLAEARLGLAKPAKGQIAEPLTAQACEMVRISFERGLAVCDRAPVLAL